MKVKIRKILLNDSGSFLSRQKGCLVVKDIRSRKVVQKYPILEREVGEIHLASGNLVSTGALVTACYNHIPVVLKTALGSPVGILHSIDDYSHVETRMFQWETFRNIQSLEVAKEVLLAKLKGQNEVLRKYGLKRIDYSVLARVNELYETALTLKELENYIKRDVFPLDALDKLRPKLLNVEGKASQYYFRQIFTLFPESFRPETRRGFKVYDGLNNTLNLAYRILFSKALTALLLAKLEPYLGFLHTTKFGNASLVLDFMEIYRYLMDDFLISFCRKLDTKDFALKDDSFGGKKGKRVFLNRERNKEFLDHLEKYFQSYVVIPRVNVGKRQKLDTLISEEALVLARYIRSEKENWTPRIVKLD
jgi:CRISPR-associated protein Cas1